MAYKRVEFYTKRGKRVSFRARIRTKASAKPKARVGKKVRGSKPLAKRKSRSKASLHDWGYGRVT